jgi:hypothetical protein
MGSEPNGVAVDLQIDFLVTIVCDREVRVALAIPGAVVIEKTEPVSTRNPESISDPCREHQQGRHYD